MQQEGYVTTSILVNILRRVIRGKALGEEPSVSVRERGGRLLGDSSPQPGRPGDRSMYVPEHCVGPDGERLHHRCAGDNPLLPQAGDTPIGQSLQCDRKAAGPIEVRGSREAPVTRTRRDPVAREDQTVTAQPDGRRYISLTDDPDTGGWTRLLIWPAGRVGGIGHETDFEYHTPQEEIFILGGSVDFGDYYRAATPSYLNHPPYWLHPAEQRLAKDGETTMLIRLSKPIDFGYVPIPADWDGREYFAEDTASPRGIGISVLPLDNPAYAPVLRNGMNTGEEAAVLWENPADDVVTWLWRLPPGWQGSGAPWQVEGASDEVYVLSGDLTTVHGDRDVHLAAGSYYCYSDVLYDGGERAHSDSGLLAVRWSTPAPGFQLPPAGPTEPVR